MNSGVVYEHIFEHFFRGSSEENSHQYKDEQHRKNVHKTMIEDNAEVCLG